MKCVLLDKQGFIDSCFVLTDVESALKELAYTSDSVASSAYYRMLLSNVTELLDDVYMPKLHSMGLHDRYSQRLLAKRGMGKR